MVTAEIFLPLSGFFINREALRKYRLLKISDFVYIPK